MRYPAPPLAALSFFLFRPSSGSSTVQLKLKQSSRTRPCRQTTLRSPHPPQSGRYGACWRTFAQPAWFSRSPELDAFPWCAPNVALPKSHSLTGRSTPKHRSWFHNLSCDELPRWELLSSSRLLYHMVGVPRVWRWDDAGAARHIIPKLPASGRELACLLAHSLARSFVRSFFLLLTGRGWAWTIQVKRCGSACSPAC